MKECCKNCTYIRELKLRDNSDFRFKKSTCCILLAKDEDAFVMEITDLDNELCECFDSKENILQMDKKLEKLTSASSLEQFKWERDIAMQQLESIGLSLGEKTDRVQKALATLEEWKKAKNEIVEEQRLASEIFEELYDNCKDELDRKILRLASMIMQTNSFLEDELSR